MKITIELTSLEDVKAVVAALEGKNTQAAMTLAPRAVAVAVAIAKEEPKPEAKRVRRTKAEIEAAEAAAKADETVETAEEVAETKNDDTGAEAVQAGTVEAREGDIDDATIREVGGKLLREMNAKGKDGVAELTKILASLSSKKVIEIPLNLRPRFVAKVNEALA